MSGFINVTGWSDQAVKRLGQMDEDNDPRDNNYSYRNLAKRNPYAYRRPQTRFNPINYNADDVWAAAVQATEVNGGYVKALGVGLATKTNRQLVDQYLSDPVQIKQESRDKAELVRKYYKALTFKILQGKKLSDFLNTAMIIADRDVITANGDISVITSLPHSYENAVKRDKIDNRINFADGGFIGSVGDKVSVTLEVVKNNYSAQWDTWYVTGITDDNKVLFFAYKKALDIGSHVTIEGTVKAHRDNSTQLNRVKVK